MSAALLVDPVAVRKFVALVHERAAAAIYGLKDPRPCVLHLDWMAPDDKRFWHAPYSIGDTERMVKDALIEAEAGKNVFLEPRLVRPGRPTERGGLYDTQAVVAAVGDGDADTDRPFTARVPPSALVETSPGNNHSWFFLSRAIGVADAVELGKAMRQSCGGDHCTGNPVQPFRLVGTPNFPNQKKRERNRIAVPTRLLSVTDKTYTAGELTAWFSADAPLPLEPAPAANANAEVHRPTYCRSRAKAILAADPDDDRSAQFMSAARYAAMGGITAEEFKIMAQQHLNGCAGKYHDRLHQEVDRCFAKLGLSGEPDTAPSGGPDTNERQRRLRWHQKVANDPQLTAGALRFANLIVHLDNDDRHIRLSIRDAADRLKVPKSTLQDGCELLIMRGWLRRTVTGLALCRGSQVSGVPDTPIGNDND
jgi:hypothetical protein